MQVISLLLPITILFTSSQTETKGLCGTPIINKALRVPQKCNSEVLLNSVSWSPTINVGDTLSFWVYNYDDNQDYQTEAVCRAVGLHAYIFVENTEWDGGIVNQQDVDILIKTFDDSTESYPTKGIYELETELFGAPPDVDNDSLVYILLLDIKGQGVAGYFWGGNEDCHYPHSNCKDIIFIDTRFGHKVGTIAHEFQHLIHWNMDSDEATWINEGCSTFSEFWVGDNAWTGAYYLNNTDISLVTWDNTLAHYDQVFLWTLYFYERFGEEAITTLVNTQGNSYGGVNSALSQLGYSETFTDILQDWAIANFVDSSDTSFYSGKYGYVNTDLQYAKVAATHFSYPVDEIGSISNTGVDYIKFMLLSNAPDTFYIKFEADSYWDGWQYYVYMIPANKRDDILSIDTLILDESWDGTYRIISDNYRYVFTVIVTKRTEKNSPTTAREYNYSSTSTGIEEMKIAQQPMVRGLFQNCPNPFNSITTIRYSLPVVEIGPRSLVSLRIYDMSGRPVRALVEDYQNPGSYAVLWDGKDDAGKKLPSGMYICQLNTNGDKLDAMKILLMNAK